MRFELVPVKDTLRAIELRWQAGAISTGVVGAGQLWVTGLTASSLVIHAFVRGFRSGNMRQACPWALSLRHLSGTPCLHASVIQLLNWCYVLAWGPGTSIVHKQAEPLGGPSTCIIPTWTLWPLILQVRYTLMCLLLSAASELRADGKRVCSSQNSP